MNCVNRIYNSLAKCVLKIDVRRTKIIIKSKYWHLSIINRQVFVAKLYLIAKIITILAIYQRLTYATKLKRF